MNITQLKARMRKERGDLRRAESNINRILNRYPEMKARFQAIMLRARQQKPETLGQAPLSLRQWQMPVASLSGSGQIWPVSAQLQGAPGLTPGQVDYRPLGAFRTGAGTADYKPLGQDEETSWWERALSSDLVSDLVDFGQDIVTHERIAADEQKQLELEIQQIQAKNEALDKQMALQQALERSGTLKRSVQTTLAENPMAIPLLVGLGGLLLFMRMK